MECHICSQKIARSDHLRRHMESVHGAGNVVTCAFCGKQFARKDSCQRHQLSAHRSDQGTLTMADAGAKRTIRRACVSCATARTRCSGGARCTRCEKRQLVCLYPDHQSRKSAPATSENDANSVNNSVPVPDVEPQHDPGDSQAMPTMAGADMAQLGDPFISNLLSYDSMEYTWSSQINWLPVMDELDLLEDLTGAPRSLTSTWSPFAPNLSQLPVDSSSTPSSQFTANSNLRLRPVESRYMDGNGGRRSLQQARPQSRASSIEPAALPILDLEFPRSTQVVVGFAGPESGQTSTLHAASYAMLARQFDLLCCRQPSIFAKQFASTTFPSHSYCSACLAMYHASFQEHFSLIHGTAWDEQNDHWILVLAAVTIGSRHDHSQQGQQSRVAFAEFLRRAIRSASENGPDCDPLPFAQACVLLTVAHFSVPSEAFFESTIREAHSACDVFVRQYRPIRLQDIDSSQVGLRWRAWIAEESHCRLLWYRWLVQILASASRVGHNSVTLPLEDYRLPSGEAEWEARTPLDWLRLAGADKLSLIPATPPAPAGFRSMLYSLYTKHKLPERVSGIGKTLLIYCLLARTEEIARSVQDPLHSWKPGPPAGTEQSGKDQEDEETDTQSTSQQWLPANPTFASWRNSACDCLDVLHWAENGDVAVEKGFEKPNVFHLHCSRILLLCPYRALVRVGQRFGSVRAGSDEGYSVADLDASVLQSLTLDDHKIRLSLVHAGAIFWHCRRYSRGMFYEPFGIFLSALLIVIYGIYLPQIRGALVKIKLSVLQSRRAQQHSPEGTFGGRPGSSDSEDDDLIPDTILLDRPCDDEIVQVFVRKGHEMTVKMSKAGDICLPAGQRIVLDEAIKLLGRSQYAHLDDCREYIRTLRKLMQKI